MSTRNYQIGGTHYTTKSIQPWDAMESWFSREEFCGFLRGNAIKYLSRCGAKDDPLTELLKARHYINRLIELYQSAELKAQKPDEETRGAGGML